MLLENCKCLAERFFYLKIEIGNSVYKTAPLIKGEVEIILILFSLAT